MPIIDLQTGVWGLVDANSPEEKQFTTYLHYWEAIAEIIRHEYGGPSAAGIRQELLAGDPKRAKKFRALSSRQFKGDEKALSALLLNAWNSELGLYLVDEDDPRVMPQNQWNNVFSYYASGRAALAWLMVRDQAVPNLLWRSRTRANYGDPSMFYVGTLGHDRAARYLRAVRTVNNATMSLFEILIAERARSVLLDTADHFMSRDRTGITTEVLARRLKHEGILKAS